MESCSKNTKPYKYETVTNFSFNTQPNSSNNFQASKLMFSPKKDKANIRRLYINKKRVPKWAQNTDLVAEQLRRQMKDPKFDADKIYGICIIERLDTNVVFDDS